MYFFHHKIFGLNILPSSLQAIVGILLSSAFKNLSKHVRLKAVMGRAHLNRLLLLCLVGSRGLKIWPQRYSLLGNQETTSIHKTIDMSCQAI